MKKVNCCVCDTLYQLFNCINLFYAEEADSETDIYIGNAFYNVEVIAQRLREQGIFRNVYVYIEDEKEKGIFKKISNKYERIVNPRAFIGRVVTEEVFPDEKQYTDIYISMPYRFAIAMILSYPDANVQYYEDGLGSYFGKAYNFTIDRKWKLVYGLFGISYKCLVPQKTYVYNKALSKSQMEGDIVEMPKVNYMDSRYRKVLRDIFDYEDNAIYDEKKCVYLTRPNVFGKKEIDGLDSEIEKQLLTYKQQCVLRIHQRDLRTDIVQIDKDEKRKLWELLCLENLTENVCLAGWFSTAQFVPKILYDMEPKILLTFPIYKKYLPKEKYEQYMQFTKDFMKIYRNKERIMLVYSVEEFKDCLAAICLGD